MAKVHGVTSTTRVTPEAAEEVAMVMAGLGAASRIQILARLRQGPCSVGELSGAVQMTQPAVSQQLRVLRTLSFVVGRRSGRQTIYELYDPHVAVLLDEALRHLEHLRERAALIPALVHSSHTTTTDNGAFMTEEHPHQTPHTHEHEHDGQTHAHAHTTHEHAHVTHEHEHAHDDETHTHPHVHEQGLETVHEHAH